MALLVPAGSFLMHSIVLLATYWSLAFFVVVRLSPAKSLDDAEFVFFRPVSKLDSRPVVCPIQRKVHPIRFEASKQTYILNERGSFEPLQFPYKKVALSKLLKSQGITNDPDADVLRETFKENRIDIPLPDIRDLLELVIVRQKACLGIVARRTRRDQELPV